MEAQPPPVPAQATDAAPRRRWPAALVAVLAGLGVAAAAGYHFGSRYLEARQHWQQALASIEKHELDRGSAHLKACLGYWPNDLEVQLVAARTFRRCGDFTRAHDHLQQAERLQAPAEAVALERLLIGVQQYGLTPVEARALAPHFQNHSPEETLILEAIVKSDLEAHRNAGARKWLNHWIEHYPDAWIARYWRGQLALANGDAPAALADLERAHRVRPDHEELARVLTVVQLRVGRYRAASAGLEAYVRRHPDDATALADLARCQRHVNQLAEARATLTRLFARRPEDPSGLLTLALLEADAENPQAALGCLDRLEKQSKTELDDVVRAASLAVSVRSALGRDAEAEVSAQRLRQLQQDIIILNAALRKFDQGATDFTQRFELGTLSLRVGLDVAAETWLQGVLTERPDDPQAHQLLAELYEKRDDPQSRRRAQEHRTRAGRTQGPAPMTRE